MAKAVQLVTSTVGTAAFDAVLDAFRAALADGRGAESLLILPTHLLVERTTDQLLDEQPGGVLLGPNVLTFASLAERILTVNRADVRHIGIVGGQELVRLVIEQLLAAGRLPYYGPIARTPGFRRAVSALIAELKRAEIFPDQFRRRIATLGHDAPERQLAEVYALYQKHLVDRGLYDAEGRFWNAKDVLAGEGGKAPVEHLHLLAVAGFSDFTGAQIDILRILAARGEHAVIGLPLGEDGRENDLFDTPRHTLSRLQAAMGGRLRRSHLPEADDAPPALAHVRDHLFALAPPAPPKRFDAIELIEEAGETAEADRIAAVLHERLAAGEWRAEQVMLVCRDLPARRRQAVESLSRHGISHHITAAPPLSESPPVRYLLRWPQLLLDDVPRRALVAMISSPYFHAPPPATPFERATAAEVEWVTRQAGILRGRQWFLQRLAGYRAWLERHAEAAGEEVDDLVRGEQRDMQIESLRRVEGFLAGLWQWLDQMPPRAPLSTFAAVLKQWAADLGLAAWREDEPADPRERTARLQESAAVAQLLDVLDELAAAEKLAATPEVGLAEFLQRLAEALDSVHQRDLAARGGGVTVTDALTARSLSCDVVVLMGLAEGEFPRPAPQAVLLSDPVRSRADADSGLLPDRRRQSRAEMLLFFQAVTRARRRLVLSFASTDGSGRQILPSPYLDELGRLFAPDAALPWGLPYAKGRVGEPVPPLDRIRCRADLPLAAAMALWPEPHAPAEVRGRPLLAALLSEDEDATRTWLAGVGPEIERQDGERFTAFDGRLADPRILERLAADFPARHSFSAGQLELFAVCPMAWFLRYLLHVEPIEPPDERIDVRQIGLLAHRVLRRFYQRLGGELGTTDLADGRLDPARVADILHEELSTGVLAEQAGLTPPERALWQIQGLRLQRMLDRYVAAETQRASESHGILPVHFEVSFGLPVSSPDADPASTPRPLQIDADGGPIRIEGRIDRVDRVGGAEGPVGIVDYKTGWQISGPADVLRGEAFQLPLYLLAAQRLLVPNCELHAASFWSLRDGRATKEIGPAAKPPKSLSEDGEPVEWPAMIDTCLWHVRRIVAGIRGGRFILRADAEPPAFPRFRHALRYGQVRLARKDAQEGGGR